MIGTDQSQKETQTRMRSLAKPKRKMKIGWNDEAASEAEHSNTCTIKPIQVL